MARRAWGEGSVFYDKINQRWTWRGTYLLNGIKTQKTLTAKRQIDLKEILFNMIQLYHHIEVS